MAENIKTLFDNEWLSIKQVDGWYNYAHMSRTQDGQLVACLVYRKNPDALQLLARYETCPAHFDGMAMTSITGGVDKGDDPVTAVLHELREEAGLPDTIMGLAKYGINILEYSPEYPLKYLGGVRPSKQEDTLCHLFCFDATGFELQASTTDGTKGEEGAYCAWVEPYLLLNCKCPLIATMWIRAGQLLGVK